MSCKRPTGAEWIDILRGNADGFLDFGGFVNGGAGADMPPDRPDGLGNPLRRVYNPPRVQRPEPERQ